jgi:disulfide bond formation protein DsbB
LIRSRVDTVLALAVLLLAALPLGVSVFVLGFALGDSPCILCWGQRTGMALIALVGLFILRYGPRPRYVGTGVLLGAYGLYMAARHSSLHLARDVGQGFSDELAGAHTYTWSALVFWVCVVTMGVLLLLLRDGEVARLFVSEGRVLKVEGNMTNGTPVLTPRQRLMSLLDWQAGQFEFSPCSIGGRDELGVSVTQLLLEHARVQDEHTPDRTTKLRR